MIMQWDEWNVKEKARPPACKAVAGLHFGCHELATSHRKHAGTGTIF
jgi:hypothetical protein